MTKKVGRVSAYRVAASHSSKESHRQAAYDHGPETKLGTDHSAENKRAMMVANGIEESEADRQQVNRDRRRAAHVPSGSVGIVVLGY